MAALIAVERWRERPDVDAFLYSSLMPSRFARQDFDVVFSEVVLGVGCVLHYCRFVDAGGGLGGGKVLRITCCCSTCRFADVYVGAGNIVGTGTGVMTYNAIDV